MDAQIIPIAFALGSVCVATYTDLKEQIIPNRLTYPLIVLGIAFYIGLGAYERSIYLMISGAAGAAIAFGIGYIMYLLGGWAGGDVKLFTALGALLPKLDAPLLSSNQFISSPFTMAPLFPFSLLINSVILAAPVLLLYAALCKVRGGGAFYEEIKMSELKEGMIPAETIYEKDGEVDRYNPGPFRFLMFEKGRPDWDRKLSDPRRAAGISRYYVGVLRKLVREGKLKDHIRIKKGTPFAPAIAAGVFVGVLYGGLYWRILLALWGI